MRFVIATQELNYLVGRCLNVVPLKPAVPLLSNILLEVRNGQLILKATDLTIAVCCVTPVKVFKEGRLTLSAKKFSQLVKELTAVNVEVCTDGACATITADTSHFKLLGMYGDEFPDLPDMSEAVQVKVTQRELGDLFFRTAFSASRDDNRQAITGVFLHIKEGKATCTGTDGKRLARTVLPVQLDSSFDGQYIVPLKAVDEICKGLADSDDPATLYLMKDKIGVEAGHSMTITKLLSGEYPDVSKVIPEQTECAISLHREELTTLLRQVSLFVTENAPSVRFSFGSGELKLSVNASDIGEGKVSMPANYHGQPIEIAFNPGLFLDVLRHSKEETVSVGLTDAYNPGVITDGERDSRFPKEASPLFILMPMRLNEV